MKHKIDEVTVSFHYLVREKKNDDGEVVEDEITENEFEKIYNKLKALTAADLKDEATESEIKFGHLVTIQKLEKYDDKYISGIYEGPYWGHSYKNSEKGEISASSLNLRPFFFLLYLADSGRVYVASQYLGNFGAYTHLKNTILNVFANRKGLVARSFNATLDHLKNFEPKEVEVRFARKPSDIAGGNTYGLTGAYTFGKQYIDDGFEEETKKGFLAPLLEGKTKKEIRKSISAVLKQKDILEVDDDEIEGCKVVVQIGPKNTKTIQLLDHKDFATRFPVDVDLKVDGHPKYEPLKEEAIKILKHVIIARNEDV